MAVYGTWFALVVNTDDYEGEFYPETKVPTYQEIRAWIKKKYGFNVNSASISQTKRKYGLIADSGDTERRYIQKVKPEKEAAILIAEGEAEYMRILSEAYNDEPKQEFYSFVRSLDALKASLKGNNKTVILSPDSPIAQIFYTR